MYLWISSEGATLYVIPIKTEIINLANTSLISKTKMYISNIDIFFNNLPSNNIIARLPHIRIEIERFIYVGMRKNERKICTNRIQQNIPQYEKLFRFFFLRFV